MAFFKSTKNIFLTPWEDEVFNENISNYDTPIFPEKTKWDYKREMKIEDVDIWEQLYYQGGGLALYAAWSPYAEFYMITHHQFMYKPNSIETYYGAGASEDAAKRAIELGMPIQFNKVWVEPEDMWLYEKPKEKKLIIL